MGLFDSLKNMFAHHEHHHGASIGQPLTLADAKAVLAFIVVHQQLADMRKVADAVKQLKLLHAMEGDLARKAKLLREAQRQ